MGINYTIPPRNIPPIDPNGEWNFAWYQYLKFLQPGEGSPETSVTVTASPFAYTTTDDGFIVIVGGTVSSVTIDRDKGAHAIQTSGAIPVGKGDVVTITYTSAPSVYMYPE